MMMMSVCNSVAHDSALSVLKDIFENKTYID